MADIPAQPSPLSHQTPPLHQVDALRQPQESDAQLCQQHSNIFHACVRSSLPAAGRLMSSQHRWCEVRQVDTRSEMVLVQVTRTSDKQPSRAQQNLHKTLPASAVTAASSQPPQSLTTWAGELWLMRAYPGLCPREE